MEIYMEFRPGTGGEEAESFMFELMDVYGRFARKNNMEIEISESDGKTHVMIISGKEKYLKTLLKESGVHRVQRESKGKLHTSTATISVYEGIEDNYTVDEKEFRYETFRASGNGGQHRNTTDSAVRLIHIPTGLTVICVSERSQLKNKRIAMGMMRGKLLENNKQRLQDNVNQERSGQILGAKRSEATRTYNYQRKEVINHITGEKHLLKDFLKGNIG